MSEIKADTQPLRLGCVHQGKRKAQRVLAPHCVASIKIEGEEVQACRFIVPAKPHLPGVHGARLGALAKLERPGCLAGGSNVTPRSAALETAAWPVGTRAFDAGSA